MLEFDGDREVKRSSCVTCGDDFVLVTGFLSKNDEAHAAYVAQCHVHDCEPEVQMQVLLGGFNDDSFDDHVTIGCTVTAADADNLSVEIGEDPPGYGSSAIWGRRLGRAEAVVHPLLPAFREVVDFVLANDREVDAHLKRSNWPPGNCSGMTLDVAHPYDRLVGPNLDEIEHIRWVEPTPDSFLVRRCHELRRKAIDEFSIEDLRIMVGQEISLPILVPVALNVVEADPLAEGDYYPGDLLSALLTIGSEWWKGNEHLRSRLAATVDGLVIADKKLRKEADRFLAL